MSSLFSAPLIFAYLLSILLVPVVITRKKKPVTAVAWILTIIFLPLVGALVFLIFGTDRIVNRGRKKLFSNQRLRKELREMEAEWAPLQSSDSKNRLPDQLADVVKISRTLSLFDAMGDNHVEIITEVDETYDRMAEAIGSAEKHVNLEYYIFEPDAVGKRFRDLLVEKAQAGVRVNFLYDAMGSMSLGWNHSFLKSMREAGIHTTEFLPLRTFVRPWNMNLRNHRKLLIVDDKIGFTGSLNVGEVFTKKNPKRKGWRETHVVIKGPAVAQLQWVFCEDWYFATGEQLLKPHYFDQVESAGHELVQVVAGGPDAREEAIQKIFVTAISQAEKSVYITTPYFIPDRPLELALQLAALRGVDVRLLVPRRSDHVVVMYAGRSYYDELLLEGVRIFEYVGSLHAKMVLVDGHLTIIGSANVDVRSFSYNFEVNVQVYGTKVAREAERIFMQDLEKSREIRTASFVKRPARIRMVENLCRLFSPLL